MEVWTKPTIISNDMQLPPVHVSFALAIDFTVKAHYNGL